MIEIPKEIHKTLHDIGLDRTEQQVYMLLIQQNMLAISEITTKLKLPRSSVHLACENLLARGVLKVLVDGKRRNFYVENPKDIRHYVDQQEKELTVKKLSLESIMPKLTAFYATSQESEPIDIEELQGEDGLVEVFYRSLDQAKNSEVLRFAGSPEHFTIAREKLKKYREERMKKKIYSRLLMPQSPHTAEEVKEAQFKMRDIRILPKDMYDPRVNMSTWGDYTAVTVWDKGLHSILIRNRALADTMKQLFEIAWQNGKVK